MIEIKNLSKHFGGIKAVNNCSFKIKDNQITALIGPNGSGKSTIFNLVSGIIKEDSGKIFFDKKEITSLSVEQISNTGISRLFQKEQLFQNLTVKENLLIAVDNEDTKFFKNIFGKNKDNEEKIKKVEEMLEHIGLKKLENTKSKELSFGQKRLVEIARTILNPHKLLILDEPVAGVTPKLREKISELLLELKKQGATILLIEHDMNFALKLADEVIVLDDGRVIAQDNPKKIKNNKRVMEAYLGE